MKLEREHVVDELIGDVKTNKFKIGEDSMGIIIDSLINLYSDPIGSIVREVTSNCYDAHREKDLKIEKVIPLGDEDDPKWFHPASKKPQIEFQEENILLGVGNAFLFRDFGVGLSKKRVEEIYTLFGNSTKRDNNHQIGGFGIGAKSPFSYTDTFYIISNHNGKKFSYMLYRGNDAFHMDLLKEGETTELNSTEVIIPLDDVMSYRDIKRFTKAINNQLMYFTGLEFINISEGTGREVQLAALDYEDDDIAIELKQQHDSDLNDIHLMVGRVRYPLNTSQIESQVLWESERIPCAIKFNVGELDLVPSREAIRYTDKTKNAIKDKVLKIQRNLKADCEHELSTSDNMITWLKQASALKANAGYSYRRDYGSIFAVKSYMAKLSNKNLECTLHDVKLSGSLLNDDHRNHCLFTGFTVNKVTRQSNGNYVGGYKLSKTSPNIQDFIDLPILFQQQIDTTDTESEETRKVFLKSKDLYLTSKEDFSRGFIQIRRLHALTKKEITKASNLFQVEHREDETILQDFEGMSTLFSHVQMIDYDNIDMSEATDFDEETVGNYESEAQRRKRLGKAFMRRVYFKDRWGKRDKIAFSNSEYFISDLEEYVKNGGICIWGNSADESLLKNVAAVCAQAKLYPDMSGYGKSSLDIESFPVVILKVAATLNKKLTNLINIKDLFKMKHRILVNWHTAKLTRESTDDLYFFSCFEKLNADLYYKWKKLKENHENNYEHFQYLNGQDQNEMVKICVEHDCTNHSMMQDMAELKLYAKDLDLLKHLEFAQNDATSESSIPNKEVFLAVREYLRFKGKAVVKFKKQKKKEVEEPQSN
tara:strand:+ start:5629 stop:8091 length:2463 start_codon:yes stop_codon:yes gene_type:complete